MEAPTNPNIDVTNLTGRDLDYVGGYLRNGGTTNYRRLLEYARSALDGKRVGAAYQLESGEIIYVPDE
jgi:cobaltochelatase CobN